MRIGFYAVGFIACAFASAEEVSLDVAIARLESGNHSLQAESEHVKAAEEERDASRGHFMPVVKVEVSAQHLDRDLVMNLDAIREGMQMMTMSTAQTLAQMQGADAKTQQAAALNAANQFDAKMPHFLDTMLTQNNWLGALTVYQPLFYGGKIYAGWKAAQAREKTVRADRDKQLSDLRRDFSRLYVQASILRASIHLRREALDAMEKHREHATNLVAQGMTDRTALLRAEIALADGHTALSDDSTKLESIALTLAQMSGASDRIYPADNLGLPPQAPASLDKLEANAVANHPLLASINAKAELADRAIDAHRADYMPEIGAYGQYQFNQHAMETMVQPKWVVGVKATMDLFNGGTDYHGHEAALATRRQVLDMRDEVSSALKALVDRQSMALEQARLRYQNLGRQEDLAKENHRVTLSRFDQGQSTSLEVVDAWLGLEKVQLERVASAGDAWIALLELEWACGSTNDFTTTWKGARS